MHILLLLIFSLGGKLVWNICPLFYAIHTQQKQILVADNFINTKSFKKLYEGGQGVPLPLSPLVHHHTTVNNIELCIGISEMGDFCEYVCPGRSFERTSENDSVRLHSSPRCCPAIFSILAVYLYWSIVLLSANQQHEFLESRVWSRGLVRISPERQTFAMEDACQHRL